MKACVCPITIFFFFTIAPPTVWSSNETTTVASLLHGSVVLKCEAKGSPPPSITWFKDKRPIVSSSKASYRDSGRSLQLSRVQLSDAGTYTCKATNHAGTVEKTYLLEVYGRFLYWLGWHLLLTRAHLYIGLMYTEPNLLLCLLCFQIIV